MKKHSRNRSQEKHRKREKEEPSKHHHRSKRKTSPVESDDDDYDFREPKISNKSSKISGKETSRSKKSSPDRRHKQRSPSVERRRGGEYKSESSSKRKRRDSSSEREIAEKRSRRDDSREKPTRRNDSREKSSRRDNSREKPMRRNDSRERSSRRDDSREKPARRNDSRERSSRRNDSREKPTRRNDSREKPTRRNDSRERSSRRNDSLEKSARRNESREKPSRKREPSGDKYSKPFYGKKTRLTVSDSDSDRSSSSLDRPKAKSKLNHRSTKIDTDARYGSSGATKHKNRFPSRHDSDSEQSAEESKLSRENRRLPFERARNESSSKTADNAKSVRNDSDKNRAEGSKESAKPESQPEIASRMTTPSKITDNRRGKTVVDTQRNGVEALPAVENGAINVDSSVNNHDSSTSSSLSYSPMEKYPHRYKDILADVSKKGQKSDLGARRSDGKDKSSPAKSDDRSKKENEAKLSDAKEKPPSVSTSKNVAPTVNEPKSDSSFCLSEVPLPPEGGASSTIVPARRDNADVVAESPKKAAKLIDSTSALVKSIPPSLSQKPNTLAASISDVITKSMRKRDASSSPDSSRKRKSRSSSKSSSSSDSSLRYVPLAFFKFPIFVGYQNVLIFEYIIAHNVV